MCGRLYMSPENNKNESVGHIVKGCLGGGIVAVHVAYKDCGLWLGLVLNILLGFVVSYLMYVLVRSAQKLYGRLEVPTLSYPDLAEATFNTCPFPKLRKYGRAARYAVDVTIALDLFLSCIVYEVVIAKSIQKIYEEANGEKLNIRLLILCLYLPVVAIGMILSLKYLAPTSIIGDIFIFTVVCASVFYAIKHHNPQWNLPAAKGFAGAMSFLGAVVFSMEGVGVTLPVENSMYNPKLMPLVLMAGMTIVVGLVILAGFFGYYGFGEETVAPITNSFPHNQFTTVMQFGMMIMIYFTFALNFWAPFNLCWVYLKKRHNDRFDMWERVYRAIIITVITIIAIAIPDITNLMGLIGSVCLSNMGFIYPAVIELLIDWEYPGLGKYNWRIWRAALQISFGVFILFLSTYFNFIDLIKELKKV